MPAGSLPSRVPLRGSPRSGKSLTDDAVRESIVSLATQYGRYGYRRISALLKRQGWKVNRKRVERIWRQERPKVPQKQPKSGRLRPNGGSCIRLRPAHRHHVWSYDLMQDRTHHGRPMKILTAVERRLCPGDVLPCLPDLFVARGPAEHIRSDNGSEFTGRAVRQWLERTGVRTLYIEPGNPLEDGYCESFNSKLRDELLDREISFTLREAQVVMERWRTEYNTFRPHSSLGYRPPAPEAFFKTFIVQNMPEMILSPMEARTQKPLS